MDALIDGLVEHNAAHGAGRRLLPRQASTVPKAMTPHELECFLVAARSRRDGWSADAFLVYSRTGLRLGELLALQRRSLLVEESALRIEQTYQGGRFGFGPPKGGKARLVEISPGALRVLERRADQAGSPGTFLFPGADPHRPMHPSTVEWAFGQAASIAALPEHFTVHSLRHTYASILLAAGAPPQWVQQQLGHAHYSITVDLYGSWLRQRRPDLTAILDREPAAHGMLRAERSSAKVIPLRRSR
jgi:integrase